MKNVRCKSVVAIICLENKIVVMVIALVGCAGNIDLLRIRKELYILYSSFCILRFLKRESQ